MAEYQVITTVAALVFAYSLVASLLEKTVVSGAIVYVTAGILLGPVGLGLVDLELNNETVSRMAEFALAICLFTDSSEADLRVVRSVEAVPVRLLLIGLPLMIVAGTGLAWVAFGDLDWVQAALIAAMLAPTDATLGKPVFTNPSVPAKVRECLNFESGLNDGICVPIVLLFIALATDHMKADQTAMFAVMLSARVIGIGFVVGLVLALAGGFALRIAAARRWVNGTWHQVPIIALAILCFGLAQWMGGSGFIASFVGGLTFGAFTKRHKHRFLEAAEGTADVVAMLTWFALGTTVVESLVSGFRWQVILYAVASLTVVRMLAVFLCLIGKGLRIDTVLFIGWFGPRGLASIVFLSMVISRQLPGSEVVHSVAVWTILLSIVLHGLTANPLASSYGQRVATRGGEI